MEQKPRKVVLCLLSAFIHLPQITKKIFADIHFFIAAFE